MTMGKWITLLGEDTSHKCFLPKTVEIQVFGGTSLQKRHAGSIWQCDCNKKYQWSGKQWEELV